MESQLSMTSEMLYSQILYKYCDSDSELFHIANLVETLCKMVKSFDVIIETDKDKERSRKQRELIKLANENRDKLISYKYFITHMAAVRNMTDEINFIYEIMGILYECILKNKKEYETVYDEGWLKWTGKKKSRLKRKNQQDVQRM